ncbi:hypothetical protein FHS96_005349 [Sphingomonas zeicaulis]|uniref:DUF4269 domain-containing protein n=1 Tax=Sphingomonas zeicaulis TaxID=1632740 RepID=UPI003D2321BF
MASGLLDLLAPFDPQVAGTPPLGLDLPGSDIDLLCHAPDAEAFAALIWNALGNRQSFRMHQWLGGGRPVIAGFTAHGWPFEIFAAAEPVVDQAGWRHFLVERRLLALGGTRLREAVMSLRRQGLKTEPAFARALGIEGNPYEALLGLQTGEDAGLVEALRNAGFA